MFIGQCLKNILDIVFVVYVLSFYDVINVIDLGFG